MIEAIAPLAAVDPSGAAFGAASFTPAQTTGTSFQDMLMQGIATTDAKIAEANKMVADFALDGSVPAHQVTFALEEARLSLELMIQVRNRLVEGYQTIMNMQV